MRKKYAIILILFLLFSSSSLFGVGAGIQLGFNSTSNINRAYNDKTDLQGTAVGTIKCSRLPICFGFGLSMGKVCDNFSIGASGFIDYWIFDTQIKNNFNLYSGLGVSNDLSFIFNSNEHTSSDIITGRIFIGLNCLLFDNFSEIYVQQAFCPGLKFVDFKGAESLAISFPVEIGMRWHF